MQIGLLGWRKLARHRSGERWYGRKRIRSYTHKDLMRLSELAWFRDAVYDVRRSMGLPTAELLVHELHIYKELGALPGGTGWVRAATAQFFNPPLLERMGMVRYGDRTKLYLSRKGMETPRVVYEEVAHSLLRILPVDSSDRDPDDPDLELYIQSVLRNNPQLSPQVIHWPIMCHLDIFRAFVNYSEAYRQSTDDDRQFARNQVRRLENELQCRRLTLATQPGCRCTPKGGP